MPALKIQAPDGVIRTIDVPDGADPGPAYEYVKREYDARQATARKESDPTAGMSGFERTAAGIGAGLDSKLVGIQQFLNAVSPDGMRSDELNAKAAGMEKLNAPLVDGGIGTLGGFGKAVGEFLPDLALGGPVGLLRKGAAYLAPSVAKKMLPRILGGVAAGAGEGALQNATTADKDYDVNAAAGSGAAFGAGGEVVGRTVGRLASPTRHLLPSNTAAKHIEALDAAGMPKPTAHTMTDNKGVQTVTRALQQLPGFSSTFDKAQDANWGWFTKRKTGLAGAPTEELVPDVMEANRNRLGKAYDAFAAGPDVPTTTLPADIASILSNNADLAAATANRAPQQRLVKLLNNANAIPSYSADAVLKARSLAAERARDFNLTFAERQAARAEADALDAALTSTHADKGAAYKKTAREYAASKDVAEAAGAPGGAVRGRLSPDAWAKKHIGDDDMLGPRTPEMKTDVAAANILKAAPNTENRSFVTNLLLAGGVAGAAGAGGLGGYSSSDGSPLMTAAGTGAGAATSLALANLLLGTKGGGKYLLGKYKPQSQRARDIYRELILAGAQQANQD